MDPLHLTTSRHDGTVTVSVSGELDIATAEVLRGRLTRLLREADRVRNGTFSLVVEVSGLSFIDAAGLGALVSAQNQAMSQDTPLRVTGAPPSMRRLLRITGLDTHLTSP
ncbi:STAS domain-containing protein [Nonomuraea sp. B1E8]|uniref:STAS domain-containing protein n=1 Tax=unclassified Nonomuraea TaxID=2593643 RepID=UPI00325CD73C